MSEQEKCSEDGFCKYLIDRVESYGTNKKGLLLSTMMDTKTRKFTGSIISYHKGKGDHGLYIDYCPFCGFCFNDLHEQGKKVGWKNA